MKLFNPFATLQEEIATLQEEIAKLNAKFILLEDRIAELETESSWWKAMDNDLASREADERSDEITLEMVIKAPDFDLEQ